MGNFIRLKVTIDLSLPLCWGRLISLENGKQIWVSFKSIPKLMLLVWSSHPRWQGLRNLDWEQRYARFRRSTVWTKSTCTSLCYITKVWSVCARVLLSMKKKMKEAIHNLPWNLIFQTSHRWKPEFRWLKEFEEMKSQTLQKTWRVTNQLVTPKILWIRMKKRYLRVWKLISALSITYPNPETFLITDFESELNGIDAELAKFDNKKTEQRQN